MNFRQFMEDGDLNCLSSGKIDPNDNGLNRQAWLKKLKPIDKSKFGKKIDKLFGKEEEKEII